MGFFKTEAYILFITDEMIKLIPVNRCSNKQVIIKLSDIKTVSISRELPVEIEIRTKQEKFLGIFPKKEGISATISFLKMVLGENLVI